MISKFITSALGLENPETIGRTFPGASFLERTSQDGLDRCRVRLGFSGRPENPPDNAAVLWSELNGGPPPQDGSFDLDLLYGPSGALTAVFPLPPEQVDPARVLFSYFDFSDFLLTSGEWQAISEGRLLGSFRERLLQNRQRIDRCKAVWEAAHPSFRLEKKGIKNILGREALPYVRVGFDPEHRWYAEAWTGAAESDTPLLQPALVIPVFPTVFSPAHAGNRMADAGYYEALFQRLPLREGDKTLVAGSGSGVDAWIASLRTRSPVFATGINPFEIANTRAVASLAGFRVRAEPANVVSGRDGRRLFPGERFDVLACNAPVVFHGPAPESLASYHDQDPGGELFLKPLARALPSLLNPRGREQVLIWCRVDGAGSLEEEQSVITSLLEQGTREGGREFRVRAEGDLYFLSGR